MVGLVDGVNVGVVVGSAVGVFVNGCDVGRSVGKVVGAFVGNAGVVKRFVGSGIDRFVGLVVGANVSSVGCSVKREDGGGVGEYGAKIGFFDGDLVGDLDGDDWEGA